MIPKTGRYNNSTANPGGALSGEKPRAGHWTSSPLRFHLVFLKKKKR
jgi:hypothetical protein